jgi:hypothetical protein
MGTVCFEQVHPSLIFPWPLFQSVWWVSLCNIWSHFFFNQEIRDGWKNLTLSLAESPWKVGCSIVSLCLPSWHKAVTDHCLLDQCLCMLALGCSPRDFAKWLHLVFLLNRHRHSSCLGSAGLNREAESSKVAQGRMGAQGATLSRCTRWGGIDRCCWAGWCRRSPLWAAGSPSQEQ